MQTLEGLHRNWPTKIPISLVNSILEYFNTAKIWNSTRISWKEWKTLDCYSVCVWSFRRSRWVSIRYYRIFNRNHQDVQDFVKCYRCPKIFKKKFQNFKIEKNHKPVKAIKEFFIDRSATNQNKNGAYRYRDYMTKMDFQWLISQIRQWDHESDWER